MRNVARLVAVASGLGCLLSSGCFTPALLNGAQVGYPKANAETDRLWTHGLDRYRAVERAAVTAEGELLLQTRLALPDERSCDDSPRVVLHVDPTGPFDIEEAPYDAGRAYRLTVFPRKETPGLLELPVGPDGTGSREISVGVMPVPDLFEAADGKAPAEDGKLWIGCGGRQFFIGDRHYTARCLAYDFLDPDTGSYRRVCFTLDTRRGNPRGLRKASLVLLPAALAADVVFGVGLLFAVNVAPQAGDCQLRCLSKALWGPPTIHR